MRKLTESIVMSLVLAACGTADENEAAQLPAEELPDAGTSAPVTTTASAGKSGTTVSRAGAGAAPSRTATAGSPTSGATAGAPGAVAGSAAASGGASGESGKSDAGGAGSAAAEGGAGAAGAATEPGASEPGVPCDVSKALAAACQRCHGTVPANGAPMSLVTLEDFQTLTVGGKPRVPKYQAALHRMNGTKGPPMPPATSPITDADKQTLIDWLGEGAPAGEVCP